MDAKKTKIGPTKALKMAFDCDQVWVAKGQKVLRYDIKNDPPTKKDVEGQIMGRSGNLRAPTMIKGKKMFVGFNADGLTDFL